VCHLVALQTVMLPSDILSIVARRASTLVRGGE
jgi:hypothetical protein